MELKLLHSNTFDALHHYQIKLVLSESSFLIEHGNIVPSIYDQQLSGQLQYL